MKYTFIVFGLLFLLLFSFPVFAVYNPNLGQGIVSSDGNGSPLSLNHDIKTSSEESDDLGEDNRNVRRSVKYRQKVRADVNKVIDLHSRLEFCDRDSRECAAVREEFSVHGSFYLSHQVDLVREHLERLLVQVQSSDLEHKEEVILRLEASLDELRSLESRIDLMSLASREDIKEISKELRDLWVENRVFVAHQKGFLLAQRFGTILDHASTINVKLETKESFLLKQDKDISVFSNLRIKYEEHVHLAQISHDRAVELFHSGEANTLLEAHASLRESHQYLKEANLVLKEIREEIRRLEGGASLTVEGETRA